MLANSPFSLSERALKINKDRVLYGGVASTVAVILIAGLALAGLSEAILLFLPPVAVAFVALLIVGPRSTIDGSKASWWRRTGAALIDVALFAALLQLAAIPIRSRVYDDAPGIGPEAFVIFAVLSVAVYLILSLPFAKQGQSIGKKLMGIQVVGLEGKPLSVLRFTVLRAMPILLIFLVSIGLLGIPLLIDFVLGFIRKDRRCFHDFIAGTKVVAFRETCSPGDTRDPA